MAQTRKDLRGRVLRKGESQRRSDERYVYTYTDTIGRHKYVYAQDLVTLREKEAQLMKDQMDGLDIYVAGKATVNFVFDRYMSLKNNLKPTTKSNYLYMYDRFIRETFGKRNIAEIKYSDVVQFYNHLIEKQELKINTLETIHTLLHPTFQLAVRDDIIRKNPTDGVMAELKKNLGMKTGVRHALTSYVKSGGEELQKCITNEDGELMAIPAPAITAGGINEMWIRQDWLDKLGLEAPRTWDELVKVAEAFVTQDPDGNGEDDTIGILGPSNSDHMNAIGGNQYGLDPLFSSFQSYPQYWLQGEDGTVEYGSIQPETRDALEKISELYTNKLIDPPLCNIPHYCLP